MTSQQAESSRRTISPSATMRYCLACLACACCVQVLAQDAEPTTPLAEAKALYSSKEYAKALEQFSALIQNAPDDLQKAEATLWQGRCHTALGNKADALEAYQSAHELAEESLIGIQALENLASVYVSLGDYEKAEDTFEKAIADYPEICDADLASRDVAYYSRNRAALDSTVTYTVNQLTELATAFERNKLPQAAALVYRKLAISYPNRRGSTVYTLKAADLLRDIEATAAALPFYLQLLAASGDRAYADKAVNSHNQPHLDVVAQPAPLKMVQAAVGGVNECLGEEHRLSDEGLQQFGKQWHEALTTTFSPLGQPWEDAWLQIAADYPQEPWSSLAQIALAECYVRDAFYFEAISVLGAVKVSADKFPAVVQRKYHVLAEARLGLGDFQTVAQNAEHLFGPDPIIASEAMLNLARAAEFSGDFAEANRLYGRAARDSKVGWHRRQAAFAVQRIASYKPYRVAGGRVFVLPDDRTTRGDWYLGYGTGYHVLCAQNFLVDRTGGPGPALAYAVHTTDPAEKSRLWVTAKEDSDPAALWDPVNKVHRPANRDDYGEQYAIGKGPDLLIDLEVPAGDRILSFYFVNDHNYYEPNREYTITLEAGDETLAITDVKDFAGGVYKRFAVRGPLQLTAHICRNVSMNTILSGVFLDGVTPLISPPYSVNECVTAPPLDLRSQYDRLRLVVVRDPVRAATYTSRFFDLTQDLRQSLAQATSPDTAPWAWWTLSECYRLMGQFRRSESAFDRHLAALAEMYEGEELLSTYRETARQLMDGLNGERSTHLALSRQWDYRDGEHRCDRTWDAYISALQVEYADEPCQIEEALRKVVHAPELYVTRYAKRCAFLLLQQDFPKTAAQADTLASAALAAKSAGDKEQALELMQKALAAEPGDRDRPSILFNLLVLQANTGVPLEHLQTTYQQLEPYGKERRYASLVRSGLYELANAHYRAQQYQDALELLKQYGQEYGSDQRLQNLIADCRQCLLR